MLQSQVLTDLSGMNIGVFIPMQVWNNIKRQYPDIESFDADLPQWEKDFIDNRLAMAQVHPERLQPIETLFQGL